MILPAGSFDSILSAQRVPLTDAFESKMRAMERALRSIPRLDDPFSSGARPIEGIGMRFKATVLLVLCMLLLTHAAWACPNCKYALPDSDDLGLVDRLRAGFGWSYAILTVMPFAAVATIGTAFYRQNKMAERAANERANNPSKSE
jgi:hypothetical protein